MRPESWRFDKTEGIAQSNAVADYLFDNAFEPVHRRRPGRRW